MLKVTAEKYILDFFPGAVAFYFFDAMGERQSLIEKLPVLGLDYPEDPKALPFEFEISYDIVERLDNEVIKIRLQHNISDQFCNSEFFIKTQSITKK